MATVASSCGPKLEAVAHIDISKLSQSELHALSLCSDSAYDLRRTDDVVIPQIDRSLFNESAGSRRQTYSRLRHHHHHRSRVPGLNHPSISKPKPHSSSHPENHAVLHFLKYFLQNPNSYSPPPPPPPPPVSGFQELGSGVGEKTLLLMDEGEKKRKRGRKPKDSEKMKENAVEIVNKNGEVVDLNNLENHGDELYSEELKKRTVGLKTEEEVYEFLKGLEGQWCSRRKKRKYVDASEYGDFLPIGWKLLLALRRRDGCVWVYCRRYVSPTGQQFISCKEASSFLRSHFLSGKAKQLIQQVDGTVSGSVHIQGHPLSLQKGDRGRHDVVAHSIVPSSSTPVLHGNELCLMDMDNLPEVKVEDLFECYKCNLTFDEKNAYLQHLFSFHQRTTRRYRVGTSVGDGVIIKDGKYECQFCHKVFDERRSYTGHVGVHVRNNARRTAGLSATVAADKIVQSPPHDGLLSRTSKMDALMEIAQSSVVETSYARPGTNAKSMPSSSSMNLDGNTAANVDQVVKSSTDPGLTDKKAVNVGTCHDQDMNQPDNTCMAVDLDQSRQILANEVNLGVISANDSNPEGDDMKRAGSNKPTVALGNRQTKGNDEVEPASMGVSFQENATQNGLTSYSVTVLQSWHHPEGDEMRKAEKDKPAVCQEKNLTKASDDVQSETMELIFQEDATSNGFTSSSGSILQLFHNDSERLKGDDTKKDGNDKPAVHLGNSLTKANGDVGSEAMDLTFLQSTTQDGLTSFSEPMVQSFNDRTAIQSGSTKDVGEISAIGQNLDNETGFEEFRLDEIEHFKYSFDDGEESPSLPTDSVELGNDVRIEEAFESIGFDSGGIILNMAESHQLSTICVWCRAEFRLEAFDSEAHSDSIGFMCPDCKAKIYGHLDSGISMSPHSF